MSAAVGDAGLRAEDWEAVDRVVRETFKLAARVRRVLPAGPASASPYRVVVPTVKAGDANGLTLDTEETIAPTRISCLFRVRSDQLGDVSAVSQLARSAAARVAAAEDLVLTFGKLLNDIRSNGKEPPPLATPLALWDDDALERGLAPDDFFESPLGAGEPDAKTDALGAVTTAINALRTRSHFGPYAALLLSEIWASASTGKAAESSAIANLLGEGGAFHLLPDPGGYPKNSQGPQKKDVLRRGVLISLGSGAFDLIEVEPPHVAMVKYDEGRDRAGGLVLRVEERVALRVMDSSAAERIVKAC